MPRRDGVSRRDETEGVLREDGMQQPSDQSLPRPGIHGTAGIDVGIVVPVGGKLDLEHGGPFLEGLVRFSVQTVPVLCQDGFLDPPDQGLGFWHKGIDVGGVSLPSVRWKRRPRRVSMGMAGVEVGRMRCFRRQTP